MDYNEKFKNRINGYMYASSKYEKVLENEYMNAVEILNPMENEKILHIAAAGINIKKYIKCNVDLTEVEQNEEFARIANIDFIDLNQMPYQDNTFDKVIVIATFHHLNNIERNIIYKEIYRVLKPSGTFILGDIEKNSMQDKFLNGFLNKYNPNGHDGIFFNWSDLKLLQTVGFNTTLKRKYYTWNFESKSTLEDFCYHFFHLLNIDKNDIYTEIKKYLTIHESSDQTIKWNWGLIFFIAKVPCNKIKSIP